MPPLNKYLCFVVIFQLLITATHAQSLEEITRTHETKREQSLKAISTQRSRIDQERQALAHELQKLESDLATLKEKKIALQKKRDTLNAETDAIRLRSDTVKKDWETLLQATLPVFFTEIEKTLSPTIRPSLAERFDNYRAYQNITTTTHTQLQLSFDLLLELLKHNETSIGGKVVTGKVIDGDDILRTAQIAQLGPLHFAYLTESKQAGTLTASATLYPRLVTTDASPQIATLFTKGEVSLPINLAQFSPNTSTHRKHPVSLMSFLEVWGIHPLILFALFSFLIALLTLRYLKTR